MTDLSRQYAVNLLSLDSGHYDYTIRILAWIQDNSIPHEIRAARIRFRPHTEHLLLQYYLQYSEYCYPVEQPYPTVF